MHIEARRPQFLTGLLTSAVMAFTPQTASAESQACKFVPLAQGIVDLIPDVIGDCLENVSIYKSQPTTNGTIVFKGKYPLFTDGYRTYAKGPEGLQDRFNEDPLFDWEEKVDPYSNWGLNAKQNLQRAIVLACDTMPKLCILVIEGAPKFEDFSEEINNNRLSNNAYGYIRPSEKNIPIHINAGIGYFPTDFVAGALIHEATHREDYKKYFLINTTDKSDFCFQSEENAYTNQVIFWELLYPDEKPTTRPGDSEFLKLITTYHKNGDLGVRSNPNYIEQCAA